MFLSSNESVRRYCQRTAVRRHSSSMAERAAKIRGGKVEIRKEHIEIYKNANFQNSRKTFQVKLPNDCTKLTTNESMFFMTSIKVSSIIIINFSWIFFAD